MTNEEKFVLDELSKESPMVISTAYIYAKNYVKYGCDITKAWSTAVEQASILERVKTDAQAEAYESLKKDYDTELKSDMEAVLDKMKAEIESEKLGYPPSADYCKAIMKVLQVIDKYKLMCCNPLLHDDKEEEE